MPESQDITDKITTRYLPKAILTVYERQKKVDGYSGYDDSHYYLESRPVLADGTPGAARPVSKALMAKIASTFTAESGGIPHGPLPDNLLFADVRAGHEKYVWWTPPGPRNLYFSERLEMKDGVYLMPGTVYMVRSKSLYVYAFRGNKPSPNRRLLYGPFFNYGNEHHMCLGNATATLRTDPTWNDLLKYWETLFWNSVNSHTTCNPMKKGYNLIVALKDAMQKPFDTSLLNESKSTLKDLLSR